MATQCSILAWGTPGRGIWQVMQSMGLQRVRHDWGTKQQQQGTKILHAMGHGRKVKHAFRHKSRHTCLKSFRRSYFHKSIMESGFYLYLLCMQTELTNKLARTYFPLNLQLTKKDIASSPQNCCSTLKDFEYGNVLPMFSLAALCPNHAPHPPLPYDCIISRWQLIFTRAVWWYLLIILSAFYLRQSTFVCNKCLMAKLLGITEGLWAEDTAAQWTTHYK